MEKSTPFINEFQFLEGGFVTRGVSRGGDLGVKTPPSMEILFNLLGFCEKKIPKHHPKFCHLYKKFQNTTLKKMSGMPLGMMLCYTSIQKKNLVTEGV